MPIMAAPGVEFIPGYQLVDRLGYGGYGEVWRTTAPGGLFKAMKIIYGDLTGPRAEQELKSLERIKSVRYPFLLSLERFEIVHGQLLILTELAERSLMNRFQECQKANLPGIPREELLGYLGDTAEALDYMNETHGLQHLDIKPENLLLLSGRIKVADFGLVKDLLGTSTHITGGVTPIYASPEAFDGRVSRFSDQYSLAIVYQEMLTGRRPFPGTTPFQLAAQHSSARPLLDALPPRDKDVIARALAKVPDQRFRSCRELIARLRGSPSSHPSAPTTPVRPAAVPPSVSGVSGAVLDLPTQVAAPPAAEPGPSANQEGVKTLVTKSAIPRAEIDRYTRPVLPGDPEGFRPVLFLGVGGLAARTLRQLRARLHRETGGLQRLPIIRMLLIDTDRASLRHAQQGPAGEALLPEEVVHCPLFPTEHYRAQSNHLLNWLDRRWLYGIPRSLQTDGLRPLGRLALVDHAAVILSVLREAITGIVSHEARTTAVGFTGRALRSESPRVFVIASIGGGTGSGMVLDLAFAVRQVLEELGLPTDDLTGMLVHAVGERPDDKARARINAHATLRARLWHWACQASAFPGAPEQELRSFALGQVPFGDCYLLNELTSTSTENPDALIDHLAAYLSFDATLGGGFLDRLRQGSSQGPEAMTLRSGGLSILSFPRAQLIDRASEVLSRRLLESWRGEINAAEQARLERQARDTVLDQVSREVLQNYFTERLPALLGQQIEELYESLAGAAGGESTVQPGSAESRQLLERIEAHLGSGIEPEVGVAPLTSIETAFQEEAKQLADGIGTGLIDWLLDNVETPGLRLRAGEISLNAMAPLLRAEVEKVRQYRADMRSHQLAFRERLLGVADPSSRKASRFFNFGLLNLLKSKSKDERQLWAYFCLRLEELIEEFILAALQRIQSRLSGWGLELTQSRRKLAEFLAEFPARVLQEPSAGVSSTADELLPYGAENRGAALTALLAQLPPDLLSQLDRLFQTEILDSGGGLWTLLTGSGDTQRRYQSQSRLPASVAFWNMVSGEKRPSQELRDEITKRARLLIGSCLNEVNLSGLLLERNSEPEQLRQTILDRLAAAQLTGFPTGAWQHVLFVLPNASTTAQLRATVEETIGEVPLSVVESGDALVVNWETAGLSLQEVASNLAGNDPEIAQMAEQLQTRRDIDWMPF